MGVSNDPKHMFAAPIPGASLTKQPNSAPWQQPAQFTDVDKALDYMWNKAFKDPATVAKLIVFVKQGIAITEIVNTLLFAGIAGSKWSVDVALLMYQAVAWQVEALMKARKIEYTFKRVQPDTANFLVKYREFLIEPENEATPVEKVSKKIFSDGFKV